MNKNGKKSYQLLVLTAFCLINFSFFQLHSMEKEEKINPQLIKKERVDTSSSSSSISRKPSFVVSIPAYVSSDDESGSDSDVDEDAVKFFEYEESDISKWPYLINKKKRGKVFKNNELIEPIIPPVKNETAKRTIVDELLKKLQQEAFVDCSPDSLQQLSLLICLNRPKSLSSKKNHCLKNEVYWHREKRKIKHVGLCGQFWYPLWERTDKSSSSSRRAGNPPTYQEVRSFYHYLKQQDKKNGTNIAKKFRRENESGDRRRMVPYRSLRELTKILAPVLVKGARQEFPNNPVYLVGCDADTRSFNGCFSTLSEIVESSQKLPDVMTTGYLFDVSDDSFLRMASLLDMRVREATAKFIQMGVYYPEPILGLRVPEDYDTVPESFEEQKARGPKVDYEFPQESPIILSDIAKKRANSTFAFRFKNPLMTTAPERATQQKKTKSDGTRSELTFTAKLGEHGKFENWTIADLKNVTQNAAQSHASPHSWSGNVLRAHETHTKNDAVNGILKIKLLNGEDVEIKVIGAKIWNIGISILSRLFVSYDPISLADDSSTVLIEKLKNYEKLTEDKPDYISPYVTSRSRSQEYKKIDAITSKKELKYILSQLLKNADVDAIDNAARASGRAIADVLNKHLYWWEGLDEDTFSELFGDLKID